MIARTLFRLALSCAALSGAALGQGSTWHVSQLPCPGTDFASIQEAVDAAADGDTLVISGNVGLAYPPFTIDGKSLTLVGRLDAAVGLTQFECEVLNLAQGQQVILQDLDMVSGLLVRDCAGPVWIEDCSLTTGGQQPQTALRIEDTGTVTLNGCTVEGIDGEDSGQGQPTSALETSRATVLAHGSTFRGGDGRSSTNPDDGSPSIIVGVDGFLLLNGCDVSGGSAGFDQSFPCGSNQIGGDAVILADVQTAFWTIGTTLQGGSGGGGFCPGTPGMPLSGPGAFHWIDLGDEARGFSAPSRAFEGQTVLLDVDPQPGDESFLLVSLDVAPVQLPGFNGALLPSTGPGSLLIPLGALGGPASLPATLPTGILSGDASLNVSLQVLHLAGGVKFAGPGAVVTVHDDALLGAYDCATIWVDDDAPGDPGPGDESLSDPLEDGTILHPFDSLAEAIALAATGSEVVVRPGSYTIADSQPFFGKQLVVRSEFGPETCELVAGVTGFSFSGDPEGSELRGFTIRDASLVAVRINVGSLITLRDCILRDNDQAVTVGGFSQVQAEDCVFRDNTGGAIEANNLSNVTLTRCTLLDNTSSSVGAGVYAHPQSFVFLRDSIITGNTAIFGSAVFAEGTMSISGCTIAHNPAGPGSELFVTEGGQVTVDNSILWGGKSPIHVQGTGSLELDWSNVKGGQAGLSLGGVGSSVTWGANTLDVLPNFKDVTGDDLRLKAGSPCRDAGDPAFDGTDRTDIDGEDRVQGGRVDMGADELP